MSFQKDKQRTLNRKDNSKKGSIDKGIKKLVDIINGCADYCTTSSCSGRILLIAPARKKNETEWLYTSHNEVKFTDIKKELKKLPKKDVYFKQESFIIHVNCKDIKAAAKLLEIANRCGCKRAGIITANKNVVVEIISTEHFDTIIAKKGKLLIEDDFLKILLNEANSRMKRNREKIKRMEKEINAVHFGKIIPA